MKRYIQISLLGLLLIFIGWNAKPDHKIAKIRIIDGNEYVVSTEIIVATTAADLQSIPSTVSDVLVFQNLASTLASGTLNFPTAPINGQTLSMSCRSAITSLTLSTGAIPISGGVTTVAAGNYISYAYSSGANRWYKNF